MAELRPGAGRAWGGPGSPTRDAAHGPGLRQDGRGEEPPAEAAGPAWEGHGAGLAQAAAEASGVGAAPPTRARKQRYLSPVWEEEPELAEPAGAPRGAWLEARSPDLLRQARLRPGCGSPGSPLFRSFFAEECRAIVRRLERAGPELATIEVEPLPLETTWSLVGEPAGSLSPDRAERQGGRQAETPRGSDRRGSEPQARPQEEEGSGDGEPSCQSRGARLSSGALPGLQALNALNLTVELQGSGRSSASLRQITFEISAAAPLGSTLPLPVDREPPADQESEAEDLERSRAAYRARDLEIGSNESTVSLGSISFATSTPLMGPAKFHFVTGSPLGDDLEQRDPSSSRRSVPRELTCPSQAGGESAAPEVTQSTVSKGRNLPEESCGKGSLKPAARSTALPLSSRRCASAEGQAAIKSLPVTTPGAGRSLALASFEPRRASPELQRVDLPPRSRGIACGGRAARLSLGNARPSMQKAAATGKTSQGSSEETQPAAQLPASGTARRSAAKLPCGDKCPSSLRPPARPPGLSGSRPVLMGSRFSLGPSVLCMSKGAGTSGSKLPTHPGTRLRLMKPRPSGVQHTNGTLQPACSLPTVQSAAKSSPKDKETESAAKPLRKAAATALPARAPHSRLRPPARTAASPRRLPSPKRARLGKDTNSAARALEPGGEGLSLHPKDKPARAVGQDLPSAGGLAQPQMAGNAPAPLSGFLPDLTLESGGAASSMQLPGQLLSQELQRVRSELQRVKNELAAREAQCEAYRRTISSLEAQLRAGSPAEGWAAEQDWALGGE